MDILVQSQNLQQCGNNSFSISTTDICDRTLVVITWNVSPAIDEIGVFRSGRWILDFEHNGVTDCQFQLGLSTDTPLVGNFNNDGLTDIGVFRASQWILDYDNNGVVDLRFPCGLGSDIPLVGKWSMHNEGGSIL